MDVLHQEDHVFPHRHGYDGSKLTDNAEMSFVIMSSLIMALVSCLGVLPLYFFHGKLSSNSLGLANAMSAGVMIAASFSLLAEIREDDAAKKILGLCAGAIFMLFCQHFLDSHENLEFVNLKGMSARKVLMVIISMAVHSAGEGGGVGVSFASNHGLEQGLLVAVAIGFHNIPEATATCVSLLGQGASLNMAAAWSILCNIPQVLSAIPAFYFVHLYSSLHPLALGFAAGCMFFISLSEIIPESIQSSGTERTAMAACMSVAVFEGFRHVLDWSVHNMDTALAMAHALSFSFVAGASTAIGGIIVAKIRILSDQVLSMLLGLAAGVMIILSIFDLILPSVSNHSSYSVAMALFIGIGSFLILAFSISDAVLEKLLLSAVGSSSPTDLSQDRNLSDDVLPPSSIMHEHSRTQHHSFRVAALTSLALAAHNAPEGLAVGVTSMLEDTSKVWLMMFAMGLHNIPEGIAVAAAMYHATQKKELAVIVATLTGLVEPLAAVSSVLLLHHVVTPSMLELVLIGVGGLMIAVSFKELLPESWNLNRSSCIVGTFLGGIIMYLGLAFMDSIQASG